MKRKYSDTFLFENIEEIDENEEIYKDIDIIDNENMKYFDYYIIYSKNNKRLKMPKCSGCYPIFQYNQEGHYGFNGCLEEIHECYFC
jgi:hypothetical protein